MEIPDWVLTYLERCAEAIYQQQQKDPKEATPVVVLNLLQFSAGKGKLN